MVYQFYGKKTDQNPKIKISKTQVKKYKLLLSSVSVRHNKHYFETPQPVSLRVSLNMLTVQFSTFI